MTGAAPAAGQPAAKKTGAWVVWLVIGLSVVICGVVGAVTNDGDTKVSAPAADERADTVAILRDSAAGQGLCYGWAIKDYWAYGDRSTVSAGSNLGDGVSVEENPACPVWVQVTATIRYVSESSESNDTARVEVTGSPDIDVSALYRMQSGLARFGLTDEVFLDDPGWATTRAAVMLPLLAAEAGLVPPVGTPPPATGTPAALPDAGSDLWRDRWGMLLAAAGILLFGALLIGVGVARRRRATAPGHEGRGVVPAQRAGAATVAPRTREDR